MTPPKVGFLRQNKALGPKKGFLGPTKTQKIDFLKKPEFHDLSEHWRWFPQWPGAYFRLDELIKLAILPPVAPKPKLESKSFRSMTPPKVGFLWPN